MATANTTAVKVALEGVVEAERAIKRLGPTGEAALEQLRSGASKASGALESIGTAANQNLGRYKQLGEGIRSAGYQFGDFAVQVQSGTSAIIAGTQQLSQFAGSFGIVGAAIGGLLSVGGAFYTYMTRQNDVTKEAPDYLEDFGSAIDAVGKQIKSYSDLLSGATGETEKLLESFAKAKQESTEKAGITAIGQLAELSTEAFKPEAFDAIEAQQEQIISDIPVAARVLKELGEKSKEYANEVRGLLEEAFKSRDPQVLSGIINQLDLMGGATDTTREAIEKLINKVIELQGTSSALAQSLKPPDFGPILTPKYEALKGQDLTLPQSTTFREAEQAAAEKLGEYERDQVAKTVAAREAAAKASAAAAKTAADAAKREAEQRAKAIEQLELELDATNRLGEAKGAYAIKLAQIEDKRKKDQADAARDFAKDQQQLKQAQQLIDEIAKKARIDASKTTPVPTGKVPPAQATQRQAERESAEELGKYELEITRQNVAKQEQLEKAAADKRARLLESQFEHMADVVTDTVAEGLQQAFDGEFDFTSLTESFGDAFKQTLSQTIAISLTAPLNEVAKGFSQKLMASISGTAGQPGLSSLSRGEAGFAGAAGGFAAGGIYSQVAGLKPGNQAALGGAIGGGLGAVAGSFIPGVGTIIGGVAGAAAGSALGGLFGGQNNLGNDRSAQSYRTGKGILYSDASFSQENRNITQGILTEIQTLEDAFKDLGGNVANMSLRIEAGNKTGITVDGKKYPDAQSALVASIEKLIGGTTGLSATQQTILANTKGASAAEIGADLAFGEQYDQLVFNGREVDRVLEDLSKQFSAASRQAAELGLNTDLLAAAHQKAAAAVAEQYEAERAALRDQLSSIGVDTVGQQFRALEVQFQDLAKAAANLNVPLDEVTAAHQRAAAELTAQVEAQKDSLNLQIAQLGGDDSVATQLFALNVQVQELARQATALGIPLDDLAAAHQRAAARIVDAAKIVDSAINDQTKRSVQEQIANARGDKTLGTQLHILETRMRDLAVAAEKVGVPLSEVTKAHAAAGVILTREFEQSKRRVQEQIAAARGDKSLGTQLHILATQMQDLAVAAADLGIPLKEVTKAHELAGAELERQYEQTRRGVQEQIANARGDKTLGTQLYVLETQMRELAKAATDLGFPLAEVTKAHQIAADKLKAAYARSQEGFRLELRGFGAANDNDISFALAQLAFQFKELADRAKELEIPLKDVTEAHKRAADEIIQADKEMRAKFLRDIGLIDATDLERELAGIRDRFKELIDQAVDLGYATDGLRKSQAKAEQEAIEATRKRLTETERSLVGAQSDVFDQIGQFLDPLKQLLGPTGVGQGIFSGGATAKDTLAEFRKTLALARGGDVGALQSIGGIGQSAIQAARAFGASGTQASAAFREVTEGFREIQGELEEKRTALIKQGLDYQKLTLDEQIRQRIEVVTELRELRAELKRSLDMSRARQVS